MDDLEGQEREKMPHERGERKEINCSCTEKSFLLIEVQGEGIIARISQESQQRFCPVSVVKKQDPKEECCMDPGLA